MSMYLNPGNEGFKEILNSSCYIDKTGIISLINSSINTLDKLICVSRPRRFGKSLAAKTISAYYDCSCDSKALFDGKEISKSPSYEKHLNKYNVIYLDMTNIMGKTEPQNMISFITENITNELLSSYPNTVRGSSFDGTLLNVTEAGNPKFIMIIDEWDAPIREIPEIAKDYLAFLRMMFKGSGTTSKIFAAAYMTGILPIKKGKSESALSDFIEYTIIDTDSYAPYTGFTEAEVQTLCLEHGLDFSEAKKWYDGYSLNGLSVYNPYSVMRAFKRRKFASYWKQTSAAENLITYISMDFESLQSDILRLIAGEHLPVDVSVFQNDIRVITSRDDVMTLLIHLGYLTYDSSAGTAYIPNEELKNEFETLLRHPRHPKLQKLVTASEKLLQDTLDGNENAVAAAIDSIRGTNYAPAFYNNEQALRYVIKFAYIVCADHYMRIEELPSGKGLADVVYIPGGAYPYLKALVIELKWNKTSGGALEQIKNRNYPAVLENYSGEILLAGINYDEKTKKHDCRIEVVTKQ